MLQDLPFAFTSGFVLAFMIGPVFFVLLETAATRGFRAALSFDIGVIIADLLFITVAYFTSFQLLEQLSNQPGFFVFGGVALIIYGVTIFSKKPTRAAIDPKRTNPSKKGYLGLLIKGFLLNFINIGVLFFWLVIILTVGPNLDGDASRMIVFLAVMVGSYLLTDIVKIIAAKQLKRYLTPRIIFKIKKWVGLILIVCGLVLIIKGFIPKEQLDLQNGIEKITT